MNVFTTLQDVKAVQIVEAHGFHNVNISLLQLMLNLIE